MEFDRYSLKISEEIDEPDLFLENIQDNDLETVTIDNRTYEFFTRSYTHNFDNATYEFLIVTYTKPEHIHTIDGTFKMYKTSIGYVKTKDGQVVVDVEGWNTVQTLDAQKGLLHFLDVYFIIYDNTIRIAVESVFHSVTQNVLASTFKNIFYNHFADQNKINILTEGTIVKDFTPSDFEQTFNRSNRNKKVVFLLDGINDTEMVNSGKLEYSLTHASTFENTMTWLRSQLNDNVRRYSVKCEDDNNKTASINGHLADLRLDEWVQPARLTRVDPDNDDVAQLMIGFLEY